MNASPSRTRRTATASSLRPLASAAVLVAVDQVTKLAASTTAGCGTVICPVRNESLMLGLGGGSNIDVVVAGFAGLAVFAAWVFAISRRTTLPAAAVALVVAGIVANMFDRVLLGSVRDFLVVPGNAVINVADIGVIGGLLACSVAAMRARLSSNRETVRG